MGHSGSCRIKATHVNSLINKYRKTLGYLRYAEKQLPFDSDKVKTLALGVSALEQAITIIEPSKNLGALRPIAYSPPLPLPRLALVRAVLTALRVRGDGHTIQTLSENIINSHGLVFESRKEQSNFQKRIKNTAKRLNRNGLIKSEIDRYFILPI